MPTLISDVWVPAIWIKGVKERQATFPSVLNSGAAVRSGLFDEIASGPGLSTNVPFFKDITDQSDEIQVENTAPATDNVQTTGLMASPILNRVTKNSGSALASQVSGEDTVGAMTSQIAARRMKQRNKTIIALLRGAFAGLGAASAAAALSAMRIEAFDETGVGAAAAETMSVDLFLQAKSLLGELADELPFGAMLIHPTPLMALEKADAVSFKEGMLSTLPIKIKTYRGVPIFTSESLVRAGTTSGFVFDTYLLASGVVAYGEKAQAGDTIDVASLSYFQDKEKNNEIIYDRTRCMAHLNGMKWVGTPAGQSATNAELGTPANWNLVFQTANRCGSVCIKTNA